MAGRKNKIKRISFKRGSTQRSKKTRWSLPSLMTILIVFVVVCLCAAAGAAFYFMEKYVKSAKSPGSGPLVLEGAPEWANSELKAKILATAGYEYIELDENASRLVAENLISVGWLDDIKVQTAYDGVTIEGRWRKPLALIKYGFNKFYVDAERMVLDFVPMLNLPIVNITGVTITKVPHVGRVIENQDITAAVTILSAMTQMDMSVTPDAPLLAEIDRIDLSNFDGHHNNRQPHIILYAKDNTEIIWGAEFGSWHKFLEATDEEKLSKLYSYYKEYGTLLGGAKYINLRDPQNTVPLPIDKY
jgi:hypothetical protein